MWPCLAFVYVTKCSHPISHPKAPGTCIFMRFPDDLHSSLPNRDPTSSMGPTGAVPRSTPGAQPTLKSWCSELSEKEEREGKICPIIEKNSDRMKMDRGAETQSKSSQEATCGRWSWTAAPPAGQRCRWPSSVTFMPRSLLCHCICCLYLCHPGL